MIKIKYNHWGGIREESKVIEYFANKWCTDNGYPIQRRKWVNKSRRKCGRNMSETRQKADT